jgi:hypothetical protein
MFVTLYYVVFYTSACLRFVLYECDNVGRDSSVDIATTLRAGRFGDRIPKELHIAKGEKRIERRIEN